MKVLVVPTIRENCILEFLNSWESRKDWDEIIIVEDNPTKTFDINCKYHYSWNEIHEDLQDNAWIISKRDSAIRSYGFLKAHQMGAQFIFTLDDDCLPGTSELFCEEHIDSITKAPKWRPSIPGTRTRGLPYYNLGTLDNVVANMGLWEGIPDWDSIQQISGSIPDIHLPKDNYIIPKGQYFPLCFLEKQLVTKSDGTVIRIEKLIPDNEIITNSNEIHPINAVIRSHVNNKKCQEIKIAGRRQSIKTTDDHEILTLNGYKKAKNIKKGDFLASPILKNFKKNILSDDEMYAIGLFLAEGNFTKSKKMKNIHNFSGVAFSLHAKEIDTLGKFIINFLKTRFNKESKINISNNKLRIECYGKHIAFWFFNWCGQYSYSKKINCDLIRCKNIKKLMSGYFAGDGHVGTNRNRPYCNLKTISWDLANQIKYLISSLGFYCSLNEYQPKSKNKKRAYQISLYGDQASEFINNVLEVKGKWKKKNESTPSKWRKNDSYIYFKVEKTSNFNHSGYVYNLNVKDNHTYTINNCVVKNCGMNLAFRGFMAVTSFFPLMGQDSPYRRFDDIWFGIIFKKICDHLDLSISVGRPFINHTRASTPLVNLVKEAPGIAANENFWELIDSIQLTGEGFRTGPKKCIIEIGKGLEESTDEYFSKLGRAMQIWADYF